VDARYPGDMYVPSSEETITYKTIAFEIRALAEVKIAKIINDAV
jgi:hypothetical protein